jgi:hypothetical protein
MEAGGRLTLGAFEQMWRGYWLEQLRDRAQTCLDMEMAQTSGYNMATVAGFQSLFEFAADPQLKEMAGNFLNLYWAEVVSEMHPRTGQRASAASRDGMWSSGSMHWAKPLFYCYRWIDEPADLTIIHTGPFAMGSFRPAPILRGIVREPNRDDYLSTSRRSTVRRDVYYTGDYSLGTFTYDPLLEQKRPVGKNWTAEMLAAYPHRMVANLRMTMGIRFASGNGADRILVKGRGNNPPWECNGVTGRGVMIATRSVLAGEPPPDEQLRYASNGTQVFISHRKAKPELEAWKNFEEGPAGAWHFTRSGEAYVAIRIASGGHEVSSKMITMSGRSASIEAETEDGHFLNLNHLWSPVVIQMVRAKDYPSFAEFKKSVQENRFSYNSSEGHLVYVSEAGDTYDYWRRSERLPAINGRTVESGIHLRHSDQNPYLSMETGSSKAILRCPGFEPLILDFPELHAH